MALIDGKECKTAVSEHAAQCPHCGVPSPGISYEEEALQKEIDKARGEARPRHGCTNSNASTVPLKARAMTPFRIDGSNPA